MKQDWRTALPAAAVVSLLTILLYASGASGGFLFDDYSNIVLNTRVHVTAGSWNEWVAATLSSPASELPRPLAMLSFALNHFFTGLDPTPMKWTNIFVHGLNAGLASLLAIKLFAVAYKAKNPVSLQGWFGLSAGALWSVMPINVMAVLLIVQRMESLSHTMVLAGLLCYLHGRQGALAPHPMRFAMPMMLVATIAGVGFKESAVLLPLYCLLLEMTVLGFRTHGAGPSAQLRYGFYLLITACALIGLSWLLPRALADDAFAHRNFTLVERLMTEPRVLMTYLRWILLPDSSSLGLFHDDYAVSRGLVQPFTTVTSLAAIGLLLLFAVRVRARMPLASLGVAWFLAAHALTATFLPLELVFEHRNYFAAFGICVALADVLRQASEKVSNPNIVLSLFIATFLYQGSLTLGRVWSWKDPVGLATAEAIRHPTSPRAAYHYANLIATLSRSDPGSPLLDPAFMALERARRVPGSTIAPAQALLVLASKSGRPLKDDWWSEIEHRLRSQPIGPQELSAIANLTSCAVSKACSFPSDRMLAVYGTALNGGDNPEVLNIYSNYALNLIGDFDLTVRLLTRAHQVRPQEPQYVISLAKVMIATGRPEQARVWISVLTELNRWGQYTNDIDQLEKRLRYIRA